MADYICWSALERATHLLTTLQGQAAYILPSLSAEYA